MFPVPAQTLDAGRPAAFLRGNNVFVEISRLLRGMTPSFAVRSQVSFARFTRAF